MVALAALLVTVYTLSHSGRFHIVDEVSLFAVTESVALRSSVDTNAIAWTQWVNSPGEVLGAFGPDGEVYSKKGPAPAILAVPWYLALRALARNDIQFGLLQGTLLWNGFITALTALVLWATARLLGYREVTSATLALLFGLGTIAWPYANQFFGEPVSALALLVSFAGLVAWRWQAQRLRWMLVSGIGSGVALATVTAHGLLVALLAIYGIWALLFPVHGEPSLLAQLRGANGQRRNMALGKLFGALFAFMIPLLLAAIMLLWYNSARFGNPFETGYHFESGEGFTTPIWEGLWGLIISPYRGVFWYSPILVLALLGTPLFVRRHRAEFVLICGLSVTLVGLYSMWWMWWGGFAWGPRFLVPLTPFWMLCLAPLLERALVRQESNGNGGITRRRRKEWGFSPLALGVLAVTLVSIGVQVLAVSVNFVNFEIQLRGIYPTDWEDPLLYGPPAQSLTSMLDSPVFGQLRLAVADFVANTDLAWLWVDGNVQVLIVGMGLAVLVTVGAAFGIWWAAMWRGDETSAAPSFPVQALVVLLPVLLVGVWLGEVSRHPHYGIEDDGYSSLLQEMCAQQLPRDAVVTVAPFAYQIPMNWMGSWCGMPIPVYGYASNSMDHQETVQVMNRLLDQYDRIWFVTGGLAPNDPDNSLERWLAENTYKANDIWYSDYRLLNYATPRRMSDAPWSAMNVPLVGAQTSQITVLAARLPGAAVAGGVVPVEIYYRLEEPSPVDLRWFVQVLTPDGYPVALLDTAPFDGYGSFVDLPVQEEIVEKAGLELPETLAPGVYQVIAGLYNPSVADAPRLRAPDGRDNVLIGQVVVR
jgi:hypothetical protein